MKHILISNDDGVHAPGLQALVNALKPLAKITVVAPESDHSGVSNALTLTRPMTVNTTQNGYYSVNGTPTDCVHLAITGLLEETPDLVVSGINMGANLGDDVLYSGTVAAAMEGRFLGYPALAFSCTNHNPQYLQTASDIALQVVKQLMADPLPSDTILNVNIPDLPRDAIKGFEVTRLGHRHLAEPVRPDTDPRGRKVYWVGPAGEGKDCGPGTDFHAIERGFVALTPIHVDLTDHQQLSSLADWAGALS